MKKQVMTSIDMEVHAEAKKRGLNISEELEKALRERLGKDEVLIEQSKNCDFCGREMERATADNLDGLTWLWPDERWICPSCLKTQGRFRNAV